MLISTKVSFERIFSTALIPSTAIFLGSLNFYRQWALDSLLVQLFCLSICTFLSNPPPLWPAKNTFDWLQFLTYQERSHLRILVSTKGAAIVKWSSGTQIMRKRYFENILSLKSQDTGPRYPKLVPRDPNFCLMIFLIQP